MKRVLSLVLALVMVFGTIMPAFAESTDSQAGQDLESYGIIAGNGTGLNESGTLTRAEMTVILAKLNGKATEASTHAFESAFTDDADHWAASYIAYAASQGWMSGYPDMTFQPAKEISAQEVNLLMVQALGYDVTWETANTVAADLGVAVVAADTAKVLRGEIFATLRAALDVNAKDATDTLGTALALTGYVVPTPATPDALEVVSVEAINLMQIQVVFNQEIDAAGDQDNYDLTDEGSATITSASDFELLEDGKTVVITLTTQASQQDVETLEVTDIETAEEVVVVDFEGDVTFLDTTIPTVVMAEVVGNDTIKITFSEPMNGTDKANFEVNDGKKLYIKSAKLQNNGTEALVELYSDLSEGDVEIKVLADTEDYAKFGVVVTTETLTVVEDETAPVVIGFKDATPTGVTLIWSEDIELADKTAANYYHTNSKNPIDADLVDADIDGNEMTLTFVENELPQGTAYVYVLKESVNDLWDTENVQEMIAIEVELDVTDPEVDGDVDVKTETTIEIDFTEDMASDEITDEDNYTLLDEDGDEVDDITSAVAKDADTVLITFGSALSGEYSIVLKDLEDISGNEIADTTLAFEVDDLTSPVATDFTAKIYNPGAADQMIRINFADEMIVDGDYSVLDAEKYTFNVGNATEFTLDTVDEDLVTFTVVNDGKSLEIVIPSVTDDADEGVNLLSTTNIYIAKVADAAENVTAGIFNTILAAKVTTEGTIVAPTVVATSEDTLVMTFAEEVAALDVDDFLVKDNADATLPLDSVDTDINDDGNTVVTFVLVTDLDATAKSGGNAITVKANTQASENAYGEAITAFNVTVVDEIAPSVENIVFINETEIQVVMTEVLDVDYFATSATAKNGFAVSGGDAELTMAKLQGGVDSAVVVLTGTDFASTTNLAFAGADLFDMATDANMLADFSETDDLVNYTFTAETTQTSATNVMLDTTKEFTVTLSGDYAGVYGNEINVAIVAADLGGNTVDTDGVTAVFATDTLTISLDNHGSAASYTVAEVIAAVNAVDGFTAAISNSGALATALAATDTEAAGTTATSGGVDVVVIDTSVVYTAGDVNADATVDFDLNGETFAAASVKTDTDTITVTFSQSDVQVLAEELSVVVTELTDDTNSYDFSSAPVTITEAE